MVVGVVAGLGVEPSSTAYETVELPSLSPAMRHLQPFLVLGGLYSVQSFKRLAATYKLSPSFLAAVLLAQVLPISQNITGPTPFDLLFIPQPYGGGGKHQDFIVLFLLSRLVEPKLGLGLSSNGLFLLVLYLLSPRAYRFLSCYS